MKSLSLDPLIPTEILVIMLIAGALIFIWDLFDRRSTKAQASTGLDRKLKVVALSGSENLPGQELYSDVLGLSGRPGGLINDGEFLIPVEYSPLTKKVQDRHVVQLLVHLRLIEEREGKRPPYGLLILGPEARSVKIKNTEEKQQWLDQIIAEMSGILSGADAIPTPSFYKCKSCDVNSICSASAFKEEGSSVASAADDEPVD